MSKSYEEAWSDDDWEFFQRNKIEEDEKPEFCDICGGPWPDCQYSCKIIDD